MQDLINRLFKPAFAALPWAVSMAAVLALLVAARPAHAEDPVSPSLLGPVSRGQVEAAEPDWVAAEVDATIDEDAAFPSVVYINFDPATMPKVLMAPSARDLA